MSSAVSQQGPSLLAQTEMSDFAAGELPSPGSPQMDPGSMMGQHSTFSKLSEIRRPPASSNMTKVIYILEEGDRSDRNDIATAIHVKVAPTAITLRHLKEALKEDKSFQGLNKFHFKFYFKSLDKDVGVVKEQIFDDNSLLPLYQGKVVAFIESTEGANSQCASEMSSRIGRPDASKDGLVNKRLGLVSDSTFLSTDHGDTTETDSMISSRRGGQYLSPRHRNYNSKPGNHGRYGKCSNRYHRSGHHGNYDSSVVTSDMESYVDSDDDDYDEDFLENDVDSDDDYDDYSSRISTTTEETSVSRQYARKHRTRRRYKNYRNQNMSRTSSVSSFSELSLNVIQVSLNLEVVNYLGISLVGQTSQKGDGGIYVSHIMKGGAVDLDGRIESGDMILQVNDINFNMLTNDEAVQVIREAVKKPGPIKLLVAKCWDPNPKGHFTIPRSEPVRPIDPGAWVAHTEAARAKYTNHETNLPLNGSHASYSATSTMSESERQLFQQPQVTSAPSFANSSNTYSSSVAYPSSLLASPLRNSFRSGHSVTIAPNPTCTVQLPATLTTESSLEVIALAMASPDSGLDVRDRMWLKIQFSNAFIGSDVVAWLQRNVQGFNNQKDAKKFASKLLKQGYIQHAINMKSSFSGKCYYVFSELVLQRVLGSHQGDLSPNQRADNLNGLEDGFSNGLRLTNENFQSSHTMEPSNFTSLPGQHFGLNSELAANASAAQLAANQGKPNMFMMKLMRNWDETSEIHSYGLFGPAHMNADLRLHNESNDSNHSGGGANCHDPYQSDEQMSQRSGQSVLYNPQATQGLTSTNTIASSGSNGSRQTNSSNQQANTSAGLAASCHSANNGNGASGNLLNHHYEDLQMNHTTGNLVPTSTFSNEDASEYAHQQQSYPHNGHIFGQPIYRHENDDLTNGDMKIVPSGIEGGSNYLVDGKVKPKKGFFKTSLSRQDSLNGQQTTANLMRSSFRKAMGKS